jgi:hypothetical protein
MGYIFDDWKKALSDFQSSVEKDLEEIRKHKAEVQQLKADILNEMNQGRYLRDEKRIVISAPEVIIGNVDKSGFLIGKGGSAIVLRGNQINLDGAGDAGSVTTRAASIYQIAADPGIDGNEEVVGAISEVVTQARNITIQSNDTKDVFPTPAVAAAPGGVRIHADGLLELESTQSSEWKKEQVESQISALEKTKSSVKSGVSDLKKSVEDAFKEMEKLYTDVEKMRDDNDEVRSNVLDISDTNDQIQDLSPALYNAVDAYVNAVSVLAETNRQLKALKDIKNKIPSGDDFKKKTTNANVSIKGEHISILSVDGDYNYRDNDEAGVDILANKVNISAHEHDGSLKEKGEVNINAKTIAVSTANTKMKDDGKNGDQTAEGDVIITSKTVTVEAVDREIKDNKPEEKALTKDGALSVRVEKTDLSATDTEGKATGSVAVNSKVLHVKSMDVDKDKRTDKSLASGSTMLLLSEKMYVGAQNKDNKSKLLQAVSEEVGLFADKTLEVQQDNGKAMLQLSGGNAAVSGSKTQIYGATTINAKTEIKDELKAPKATVDHVEAKSSFKSSNISDGIPVPAPPASANLSAKMKVEDAPKNNE